MVYYSTLQTIPEAVHFYSEDDMGPPRRKGVSPVFPLHISPRGIPSDQLISITIESSVLLQNIIKSEIITRIDSDTIANLGWQLTADLPPQTEVENSLRCRIAHFRQSEQFSKIVRLSRQMANNSLEENYMKIIMQKVFDDPEREQLRDRIVALFSFIIEASLVLLEIDSTPDRFQQFFGCCMHFSNDVLAEKICEHGDWMNVMQRPRSKSLLEYMNSEKCVKAIRDNPGLFSLCVGCLFVGGVLIISLKKHT